MHGERHTRHRGRTDCLDYERGSFRSPISRADDPAIASDAAMLQRRLAELEDLQTEVDRLYARWAALEEKQQ